MRTFPGPGLPEGAVEGDAVDSASTVEEDSDRWSMPPACSLATRLRSMISIPAGVGCLVLVGSSTGCGGGRKGGREGGREAAVAEVSSCINKQHFTEVSQSIPGVRGGRG